MDEPAGQPQAPLTYEETPEIPIDTASTIISPPVTPKKPPSILKTIGIVIAFIALFIIGVNLSSSIRQFFPLEERTSTATPTPAILITPAVEVQTNPAPEWKTYPLISGITKQPIDTVTFQLPPEIISPLCDGVACASQGTYLPGGTRLTIAPRGMGQALRDFRGSVITDANGVPIPTRQLLLEKFTATEYESSASGKTVSGYAFSRMRGVMIPLTDTLSVEVNHFTPNGVTADFQKDDLLFNEILETFTVLTASITPIATSSGY